MNPTDPIRGRREPSIAEVAALTRRLRELSTQGRDADPAERAAFLADKDALLARITDPHSDPGHRVPPTDTGAELHSHRALTWRLEDADEPPVEMPEWMREQARRTEAQIAAGNPPPSQPDDLDKLAARIAALQERIASGDTGRATAVHGTDPEQDTHADAARWHHDETASGHNTDEVDAAGDVDGGPGWSR